MIYTITSTLPLQHGGRTKALLNRIKLIDQALNINTTILTTNYNANYNDIYKSYLEDEKITTNTYFENIYDWLADYKLLIEPTTDNPNQLTYHETPYELSGFTSEISKDKSIVRYYDNETYVLYRRYYDNTKVVKFEDYMSPISKKKVQRWQYNKNGILHKKVYYAPKSSQKILEEFFDVYGAIYCMKFFEDNADNDLSFIQTYKDKQPHKTFTSEKQLFRYYFDSKFKDGDIIFNDARLLDAPLLKQTKRTKNILVFHSSHLGKHNIKSSYKYALKNADKVTQYIVLTHQQKADILTNNVITENKISVIPHFIKPVNIDTQLPQQNRFIFIGRLVPEKQIEHIIHAYKKFVAKGYSTTLSIFGSGDANYSSYIKTLIDDLELQQKITINEYTNTPIQELQQSKASLLTSQYEGFGLTIMESIEVGCPVISYDIRYGPSEIITHGENGYLVEANNITELTEYMTKIIDSPLKSVETTSTVKYDTAINNYKQLFSLLNDA